jgi:hypothetical protein
MGVGGALSCERERSDGPREKGLGGHGEALSCERGERRPTERARGHMGERSAASEGSDGPREKG